MKRFYRTLAAVLTICVGTGIAAFLPAPAAAQAGKPFKIGLLALPTNAPFYIALAKGYFEQEGVKTDIRYFTASAPMYPAVVSGDIDVGVTGLTAATFNLGSKGGFKLIAGVVREKPGYRVNAFMVTDKAYQDGFRSLEALKGRRLANTTAGSTHHYTWGAVAQQVGIGTQDYSLIPLQSLDNVYAAFQTGQVDGSIIPAIQTVEFEQTGVGHVIGWTGDRVQWQITAIFANPATLKNNRDGVERFLRAFLRASRDYDTAFNQIGPDGKRVKGPGYDELLGIISKALNQPAAQLELALPYVDPEARLDVGSVNDQLKFWQKEKLVPAQADAASLLDLSFIQGHLNVPKN